MKTLIEYISEKLTINKDFEESVYWDNSKSPDDRDEFEQFLKGNDIKYSVRDEGHYDNSHYDIVVETPYKDVTVVYSFINKWEYLYSIFKNNDELFFINSTITLGQRRTVDDFHIDPYKYIRDVYLKSAKNKLNKARKGKRDRHTGRIEVSQYDINVYKARVERYEEILNKII